MTEAHATVNDGKPPTAEQFDMVAGHLVQTLSDLKVPEAEIEEVVADLMHTLKGMSVSQDLVDECVARAQSAKTKIVEIGGF